MALPFFDSGTRIKRDQMLAVDLGSRTTKAVHLERRGQKIVLRGVAVMDAPIFEKSLSAELLAEHLKAVCQALPAHPKWVTLTMSVNDVVVRHAEVPRMPSEELRMVLKFNAKTYLQQDLPGFVFDIHTLVAGFDPKPLPTGQLKQKVLIAGAKKQLVDQFIEGAKAAGLQAEFVVPSLIGPVNSFELAQPEIFAQEAVALVDIGFKSSSISLLQQGELMLSRVVGIGADRFTAGLAEALNVSYAEAEGIKIGMASEVQPQLDTLIAPLGRELRASIDFFEHQQDRPVQQLFLSGGSARSEFIVQRIQQELVLDCKILNPLSFLQIEVPPQQAAELDQLAPQLAVALGAGLAAL
jgi:type IV pilus assembly protein PilM